MIKKIMALWSAFALLFWICLTPPVDAARAFNGTTDRIDWDTPNWGDGQAFTFAAWIYPVARDGGGTRLHWFMAFNSTDTGQAVRVYDANNSGTDLGPALLVNRATSGTFKIGAFASISTDSWQHIIITWNGTLGHDNVDIFVNNSEVTYTSESNGSGAQVTPSGQWSLGGNIFDDSNNANIRMAYPAVFNRVITSTERAVLQKRDPLCAQGGLPAWAPIYGMGGDTPNDYIVGTAATLDGTTVVDGPPIRHCVPDFRVFRVLPTGTDIPIFMHHYRQLREN